MTPCAGPTRPGAEGGEDDHGEEPAPAAATPANTRVASASGVVTPTSTTGTPNSSAASRPSGARPLPAFSGNGEPKTRRPQ